MFSGAFGLMPSALQIRSRLADWIDGKISLSEFEDWFVPETWNIHKANDAEAEDVADEIELSLSEYSGGHLTLEQLKESLKELARPFVLRHRTPILLIAKSGNISKPRESTLLRGPNYEVLVRVISKSASAPEMLELSQA